MKQGPDLWGPSGWKFLHYVTFAYNPRYLKKYLSFFRLLPYVLPCSECGRHFQKELLTLRRSHMRNATTFSKWLVDVHNRVNRRLHKKMIPYKKVLIMYFIKRKVPK